LHGSESADLLLLYAYFGSQIRNEAWWDCAPCGGGMQEAFHHSDVQADMAVPYDDNVATSKTKRFHHHLSFGSGNTFTTHHFFILLDFLAADTGFFFAAIRIFTLTAATRIIASIACFRMLSLLTVATTKSLGFTGSAFRSLVFTDAIGTLAFSTASGTLSFTRDSLLFTFLTALSNLLHFFTLHYVLFIHHHHSVNVRFFGWTGGRQVYG
jgi:hypothetical protein